MKRSLQVQEKLKKPMSKSAFIGNEISPKNWMGQSCILQKLMTKSHPDKHANKQENYAEQKHSKIVQINKTPDLVLHKKKMSQSTYVSASQKQLDGKKFLQKYQNDLIFKHLVDKMIKKYEHIKFDEQILFHQQKPHGYTLRLKKVNQDIEQAKLYLKYKQILNENKA